MDTASCIAAPVLGPPMLLALMLAAIAAVAWGAHLVARRQARSALTTQTLLRLNRYRVPLLAAELARFADGAPTPAHCARDGQAFSVPLQEGPAGRTLTRVA